MKFPRIRFCAPEEEKVLKTIDEFAVAAGYNSLESFQRVQYDFIYGSHSGPRLLLGCRGTGKSVTNSILGIAYEIYKNPNFTSAIITKEAKRSAELVRAIASALEANGVQLTEQNGEKVNVVGKKNSISQANCKGLALGGRGFRGLHPDLIILDDPVTEIDAWSETERLRVKDKYDEIMKLNSNVAILGQPVSNKDLYSLLRHRIPTYEQTWDDIPDKFFGTIYKPDLSILRLTVSERTIQMSYFLNVPDDPSLAYSKIEVVEHHCGTNKMFIDPSTGKGDYTAVVVGNIHPITSKFTALGFCFNEGWFDIIADIKMLINRFGCNELIVEINGVGAGMPEMLMKAGIPSRPITTHENKHQKIISLADQVPNMSLVKLIAGKDYTGRLLEANEVFIDNVKNYTHDAKHDDGIDALVSLIKEGYGIRRTYK